MMDDQLIKYYQERATEYEGIYHKTERKTDIKRLQGLLSSAFQRKHLLEIGCGTGYWTQFIAQSTNKILATDINNAVLKLAKQKAYACEVEFMQLDYYSLEHLPRSFNGLFAGFVLSHIPQQMLSDFFHSLHSVLTAGSSIVIIDNLFVPGSSTPIATTDDQGNTFQIRQLKDGREFKVMKNFLQKDVLREAVGNVASFSFVQLDYFWILSYQL